MNPMYNGVPITDMAQLAAMLTPGAGMQQPYAPHLPMQQQTQYVTADQVRALIAEQLKPVAPTPQTSPIMAQFESLIQRALTPEAYKEFLAYSASGAPGFDNLLSGDALFPVIQLFWDSVKEGTK